MKEVVYRVIIIMGSHFCRPQTTSADLQYKIRLDFPLNPLFLTHKAFFNTLPQQLSQTMFITSPCVCFLNHQWCEPAQRHTEAAHGRRISLTCQKCVLASCATQQSPGMAATFPKTTMLSVVSMCKKLKIILDFQAALYGIDIFPPVTQYLARYLAQYRPSGFTGWPNAPTLYHVPTTCQAVS